MTSRLKSYIQSLSLRWLIPLAILLALAPFYPVPHLVEKLGMWTQGTLHKPLDIFDLFMHSAGLVLLLLRVVVDRLDFLHKED